LNLIRLLSLLSNYNIGIKAYNKNPKKGYTLTLDNGIKVLFAHNAKPRVYKNIKFLKEYEVVSEVINLFISTKNVFVIHGHDEVAKQELSRLLESWNLTPLVLSEVESQGKTIIELLEITIPKSNYAIALLTPDDICLKYEKDNISDVRRARQNVILELGWFIGILGRQNVTVLIKNNPMVELPSDIVGVKYHEFKESIEEVESKLKKELLIAKVIN
jgi:predicted nucleotide-binding protein